MTHTSNILSQTLNISFRISFHSHNLITISSFSEHARAGFLYIWPAQACTLVTVVLLDPLSGLT